MDFLSLIEDRSQLNYETLDELRKMVEQYPFFHQARLLYLVNLHQLRNPLFGDELRRSSVLLPAPSALFHLVEGVHYDLEQSGERVSDRQIVTEDEDRTLSLIDNFLTQQPEADEKPEEGEPHSVPTVAEVTGDYASFLAMQTEADDSEDEPLKGGDLIDSFLSAQEGKQRYELETETTAETASAPVTEFDGGDLYNEKIVEILVKQRQYAQALEILRQICLNNPEKSANFATQMQLLEIIVEQK